MVIYLITYVGQTESAYNWSCTSLSSAMCILEECETNYPDRVWRIEEKDVS